MNMHFDNQTLICIAKNLVIHECTSLIERSFHIFSLYIVITKKRFSTPFFGDQTGGIFNTALSPKSFYSLSNKLGMINNN